MIALVARVVPWMTTSTAAGSMPASPRACASASSTPSSGALGVVSTLLVKVSPLPASATSVKVPPMSTPTR